MTSTADLSPSVSKATSSLSNAQVEAWLRGLFTIAWADGHFEPQEQEVIHAFFDLQPHEPNTTEANFADLPRISAADLAAQLGSNPELAENFLRTAVMVAIADGVYSFCEDELLIGFAESLNLGHDMIETLRTTICVPSVTEVQDADPDNQGVVSRSSMRSVSDHKLMPDVLDPIRDWLDGLAIHDPSVAHFLCRMIPPQCPFERDIALFGHKVVHIPPLCKLNPLYEQMVSLRFRALSYLADECHEDISQYC